MTSQIINKCGQVGTNAYFYDVTEAGNSVEKLREHSLEFEEALMKREMTLDQSKTIGEVERITILGYEI